MPMIEKSKKHYDKIGAGRNMGRRSPTPPTPGSRSQSRKRNLATHKANRAKSF